MSAVLRAAREMRDEGTFRFTDQSVPMGELNSLLD